MEHEKPRYEVCGISKFRGGWRADFRPVDDDGTRGARVRRIMRSKDREDARREAEALAARGLARYEDGAVSVGQMVEAYIEAYASGASARLSDKTARGYRSVARRIDRRLAAMDIRECEASHVRNYLRRRLRAGARANTVRAEHSLLKNAFDKSIADGLLVSNPAAEVDPPDKEPAPDPGDGKRAEARRIARLAGGDLSVAAYLALDGGLLPCQIVCVRPCDLDRARHGVRVARRRSRNGTVAERATPLVRELGAEAWEAVERAAETCGDNRYCIVGGGTAPKNPDLLSRRFADFAGMFGSKLTLSEIRRR